MLPNTYGIHVQVEEVRLAHAVLLDKAWCFMVARKDDTGDANRIDVGEHLLYRDIKYSEIARADKVFCLLFPCKPCDLLEVRCACVVVGERDDSHA